MRALILVLLLTGCKTIDVVPPEDLALKETVYVVRVPPAELTTLPAKPKHIDPDTASQVEVSEWLIAREQYTLRLENMIKQIADFLTKEQQKLDDTNGQIQDSGRHNQTD